jgi:serine/threonine protein phosphatase 1
LAIGDIHGCRTAFDHLLSFVDPKPGESIVTLGDYVDRGPDSRGVIDKLIELHVAGQLVPLRGNHEIMMLGAKEGGGDDISFWLACGGLEALKSYAAEGEYPTFEDVPATHWHFIKHSCYDYYETPTHVFVHANLHPELPIDQQKVEQLHWENLSAQAHRPHCSGKVMICGHTEQRSGLPLNLGTAVCIDTWAYGDGWLTCLDVTTGNYWQANELGDTRLGSLRQIQADSSNPVHNSTSERPDECP